MVTRWPLALALLLAACSSPDRRSDDDDDDSAVPDDDDTDDDDDDDDDATADDDDATDPPPAPVIVGSWPEPDEAAFPLADTLFVNFDRPPQAVGLSLAYASGTPVVGELSGDADGLTVRFDPFDDLSAGADLILTVQWVSPSSPVAIAFSTPAAPEGVDDPNSLVGRTWQLDLANATFTEPPGIGLILAPQLEQTAVLMTITDETDFSPSAQPGMHIVGAVATDPTNPQQNLCSETLPLTYGPDNAAGTADDIPATWSNPELQLGPTDLELLLQGIEVILTDVTIEGAFLPDGSAMQQGSLLGTMDTRPVVPLFDPTGADDAVCVLLNDMLGVPCFECGAPNPGAYCVDVAAENIVAPEMLALVLVPWGCADVIGLWVSQGSCATAIAGYDADGDGVYEGCPSY